MTSGSDPRATPERSEIRGGDAPPDAARGDLGFDLPKPATVSPGRAVVTAGLAIALLGGLFFWGYVPHRQARATLSSAAHADRAALPRVDVVTPKETAGSRALNLPASVRPLEETVLYSRANGFVRDWKVDIGDKVSADQVLAELETPELDQELAQARAQLAQAEAAAKQAVASRDFAKSTLDRFTRLKAEGLTAAQDLDEKAAQAAVAAADVDVANASVNTQRANVARLSRLKSFASVTAPFAGTITARMIERGALVVAGNSAPLFKVAATDPVRVFVDVPQDQAPSVKPGTVARVLVREYPGRAFAGTVARTAGALDPDTRTLSTEIRVPNPDGALLTGMYVEASLELPVPHRAYELPATAVSTGAKGVRVQVVDAGGTVHFAPIVVERDLGQTVHVSTGVTAADRVLKLASPDLPDGARVDARP